MQLILLELFQNIIKMRNIFICTIVLTLFSPSILAQDVCIKKTACSCEFSNGTGFDLSPTVKTNFFKAQIYEEKMNGSQFALSTYFYHPCADAVLPKPVIPNITDSCVKPLAVCRHVNTMSKNTNTSTFSIDNGIYEYLGSSTDIEFSADGRSIIYKNGPSSTTMVLVCAETDDKLNVFSLEDPNKLLLEFYSRDACLKQLEQPGRSVGSTLLIIFFSFVIFYLVLGVCTKKFLMGATGMEVIPNLAFWSDLPNLVKDGWAFAISGFKLPTRSPGPVSSPDPNSYDSI